MAHYNASVDTRRPPDGVALSLARVRSSAARTRLKCARDTPLSLIGRFLSTARYRSRFGRASHNLH